MAVKQWWTDYDKDPPSAVGKLTNMMLEVRFLMAARIALAKHVVLSTALRDFTLRFVYLVAGMRPSGETATWSIQV